MRLFVVMHAAWSVASGLKVKDAELDTLQPWVFVKRFCFVSTPRRKSGIDNEKNDLNGNGLLEFEVTYPTGASPELLLYYDGFDDWVGIYTSDDTCSAKRNKARDKIPLVGGGSINSESTSGAETTVRGRIVFDKGEKVWVFIAFANCMAKCNASNGYSNCQGPLVLRYDLHMTNSDNPVTKEFSAEEFGVLPASIFFLCAYAGLSIYAFRLRRKLKHKRKFHHTVALLCWSIWIEFTGTIFATAHYASFATNGVGSPPARNVAAFLWHIADNLLILLVVLIAKGWTIVRKKISINGRVKIALYSTVLMWTTLALELWRFYIYDPGRSTYHTDSPPGYVLVSLRALAIVWFGYAAHTTLRNYPSKSEFYRKFNFIFAQWLVAKPIVVVVALFLDDKKRQLVVFTSELSLALIAHGSLAFMYYPDSKYNSAFPFHASSCTEVSILGDSAPSNEGEYDTTEVRCDEIRRMDLDMSTRTHTQTDQSVGMNYVVTRESVYRRISVAGSKTARLMRTMSKISADLDRALLDFQGEIEFDQDYDGD